MILPHASRVQVEVEDVHGHQACPLVVVSSFPVVAGLALEKLTDLSLHNFLQTEIKCILKLNFARETFETQSIRNQKH
jgi:hypothetical protein